MESSCTFDEALIRHVGQFGPGQWKVVAVTSLFQVSRIDGPAYAAWLVYGHETVLTHSSLAIQAICAPRMHLHAGSPSSADFTAVP